MTKLCFFLGIPLAVLVSFFALVPEASQTSAQPPSQSSAEAVLPDDPAKPLLPQTPETPAVTEACYLTASADSLFVRAGAGTHFSALGTVAKGDTLAFLGKEGEWCKTQFCHTTAYVHQRYVSTVTLDSSSDERVESVIAQGLKTLGTPYVYGAVRLHGGNGSLYSGFDPDEFDCSSLMQYVFYYGASVNLPVHSRLQSSVGVAVAYSEIQRGDLLFFTNDARKNLQGVERIGHVALYLGEGYILHAASDYAKIEKMSQKRISYFVQARRVL